MSTLIIVESYFGNTLQIAHAIADALPNAKLQSFDEAPDAIPDDIDLLLLGAPTHETALPSPKSRHSAATRNSAGSTNRVQPPPQRGLAEWAKHATIPAGTRTITFDTSAGRFATMNKYGFLTSAGRTGVCHVQRRSRYHSTPPVQERTRQPAGSTTPEEKQSKIVASWIEH